MTNTNITNFRKNLFEYVEQAVSFNDIINVSTKEGNAIVMSEDDYNGLMETLYLSSQKGVKDDIITAMDEPLEECVPETEVDW